MKVAFLFPGQGSQSLGMGADFVAQFADAQAIEAYLNQLATPNHPPSLSAIMKADGDAQQLQRTLYTQPAILAVSMMAYQAFQTQTQGSIVPVATAGHSLGEFSALVAAGVLTFQQAAQLVVQRAQLMETATEGTMAAVLGLSASQVQTCLAQQNLPVDQLVVVANDNAPVQVVISGTVAGIEAVTPALKTAGAKRVLPLPVGGAFHSPLMQAPSATFNQAIKAQSFQTAKLPVVCNVNAHPTTAAVELKATLQQQMCSGVQWTKTLETLVETLGVQAVIEFGPGKVLTGLIKKQYPQVEAFKVFDIDSLEATVEWVNNQPSFFTAKPESTSPTVIQGITIPTNVQPALFV